MGNWLKSGLFFGAGVALGAVAVLLLSRNSGSVRQGMASVLSHTMDLKDKAKTVMATAKENFEDIAAEARHESEQRRSSRS